MDAVTISLPKDLRPYTFDRLTGVELNDFDVDRLLPALFDLVLTRGYRRGQRSNANPKDPDRYIDALARHPDLRGFDDAHGRAVLAQWVNTSIVRLGSSGRAHTDVQIAAIQPIHLGAYRAGIPETGRQRKVHTVLYRLLSDAMAARGAPNPQLRLEELFRQGFGHGVAIGPPPKVEPTFDGAATGMDANVLLSLYYLEAFDPGRIAKKVPVEWDPVMPAVALSLGEDLLRFLIAYGGRLPTFALARHLATLINFGLFAMSLRLFVAVNALVGHGGDPGLELPADRAPAGTEIYVDFTRLAGGDSDAMAYRCVQRDLERLRAFFNASLRLRTLDRYAAAEATLQPRIAGKLGPSWARALVGLSDDPYVEWRAGFELEQIVRATAEASGGSDDEARAEIDAAAPTGGQLDRLVRVLAQVQSGKGVTSAVAWFWSVGGLTKSYGLLRGNLAGRRSWRYAMTDELLTSLVLLVLLDPETGQPRAQMRLADLLGELRHRWGVLVAEPPAAEDNASSRAAASANLAAFTGRLRQMGLFADLADDFNAQFVTNPLAGDAA